MSEFEFLMILSGFVIAIAMTEVVGGIGRQIRTRAKVRYDWLHLGWSAVALVILMLSWTSLWPYREYEFVYVAQIWMLVIPTLFLVVVAYALSPNVPTTGEFRVREYYLAKRIPIFVGLSLATLMGTVAEFVIVGTKSLSSLITPLLFAIVFLVLASTRSILVHSIGLVLAALAYGGLGLVEVSEIYDRFPQN